MKCYVMLCYKLNSAVINCVCVLADDVEKVTLSSC